MPEESLIELRSLPNPITIQSVLLTPPFDAANLLLMDSNNKPIRQLKDLIEAGNPYFLCTHIHEFISVVVPELLKEPPPKTEPYTPNHNFPPSPYIPLAHR